MNSASSGGKHSGVKNLQEKLNLEPLNKKPPNMDTYFLTIPVWELEAMKTMTDALKDNYRNEGSQGNEIVSFFSHFSIFTEILSLDNGKSGFETQPLVHMCSFFSFAHSQGFHRQKFSFFPKSCAD